MGKSDPEGLAEAQSELKDVIGELAALYPDLISQYDLENSRLSEKIDLIRTISKEQRDQARREAEIGRLWGGQADAQAQREDRQGERRAGKRHGGV